MTRTSLWLRRLGWFYTLLEAHADDRAKSTTFIAYTSPSTGRCCKIARHLPLGRRTISQYLATPARTAASRQRASKLDPFKTTIAELLEQDAKASAMVIAQRLRPLGFDGGLSILKEHLRCVRPKTHAQRAYVRMEPAAGERFEIDWGHFGVLSYQGHARKLYAFCLVECHSRKLYVEFTHSQFTPSRGSLSRRPSAHLSEQHLPAALAHVQAAAPPAFRSQRILLR